jgi:hypothetical protein
LSHPYGQSRPLLKIANPIRKHVINAWRPLNIQRDKPALSLNARDFLARRTKAYHAIYAPPLPSASAGLKKIFRLESTPAALHETRGRAGRKNNLFFPVGRPVV